MKFLNVEKLGSRPRRTWRLRSSSEGKYGLAMRELTQLGCEATHVVARLVYHGLMDWVRWRLKDKDFKKAGPAREVYLGNPWTNRRAWANTEVQILLDR